MSYASSSYETENKVREIISRHPLPGFVRGFDIRLDEFDGTDGFWVIFQVVPSSDESEAGLLERGRALVAIQRVLDPEFQAEVEGYFPFYRYAEVEGPVLAE